MPKFAAGKDFLPDLAEALGLGDTPIRSIAIRASMGGPVEVEAVVVVEDDEAGAAIDVLRRYILAERLEPQPEAD